MLSPLPCPGPAAGHCRRPGLPALAQHPARRPGGQQRAAGRRARGRAWLSRQGGAGVTSCWGRGSPPAGLPVIGWSAPARSLATLLTTLLQASCVFAAAGAESGLLAPFSYQPSSMFFSTRPPQVSDFGVSRILQSIQCETATLGTIRWGCGWHEGGVGWVRHAQAGPHQATATGAPSTAHWRGPALRLAGSACTPQAGEVGKRSSLALPTASGSTTCQHTLPPACSHMPPEMLSTGLLSKATDVYSFGCLCWEASPVCCCALACLLCLETLLRLSLATVHYGWAHARLEG